MKQLLILVSLFLASCSSNGPDPDPADLVPYGWTKVYNTDDYADTSQVQIRTGAGWLMIDNRMYTMGGFAQDDTTWLESRWFDREAGTSYERKTWEDEVIFFNNTETIILIPQYSKLSADIEIK